MIDVILSPISFITTFIYSFYEYFLSIDYPHKILAVISILLPIISIIRSKIIIKGKRKRVKLGNDLKKAYKKYERELQYPLGVMIDKSHEIYGEIMEILKNSDIVPPATLYFFEQGRLPVIGSYHHPNNARGITLQQLIDNAMLQTF